MFSKGKDLLRIQNMSFLVKHGEGSVRALACIAAYGMGSQMFICNITQDGINNMNSYVYRHILTSAGKWKPITKRYPNWAYISPPEVETERKRDNNAKNIKDSVASTANHWEGNIAIINLIDNVA